MIKYIEWSKEKVKTRAARSTTREEKRCLIVSNGALVRLTYVASGSVVYKMEQGKSENTDDMKQITDITKQNKR
ncbi:hypothetical protein T11_14744 [Trichinella zimbabwensis]|uniref:Uncharacterized protein n=1 Tax=Trichinella zimbabwensis TaxID=268475 RepID=A0A0V1HCM3_9BILA|nr:hypothetical protein T11_14744 [Trichinella zimbabwensis]